MRLQIELLSAILRKRPDVFVYLLIPTELMPRLERRFEGLNIQLLPVRWLSRQQGGTHHIDILELSSMLDLRRTDVDVLFINQPELAATFLDFFNKIHFFDVHCFNYVHWMDWRRSDGVKNRWNAPGNLAVLTSIPLSAVTGCNSAYGKKMIMREAARWFNPRTLEELESKVIPLYPGIDVKEICAAKVRRSPGLTTIIYPFRALKYTGFRAFTDHLANLWARRKDFRVVLTNPSNYDFIKRLPQRLPFLEVGHFSRAEYLRELWRADIVVGCHNGASQWSLAAAEAVAAECIPLFNSESFFPEMLSAAYPEGLPEAVRKNCLYYRQEFPTRLEYLLDNVTKERARIRPLAARIREYYDWDTRVDDWIRCFETADTASPQLLEETEITRRMTRMLKDRGSVSKDDLLREFRWHVKSRHISWTRYRRYLRAFHAEDWASPFASFSATSPSVTARAGTGRRLTAP